MECQIKHSTSNQTSFSRQLCLFYFNRKTHQTSHMAAKPEAKHQHLDKSLKIKYKALKELENGTTHRYVASLFGAPKNTLPIWK